MDLSIRACACCALFTRHSKGVSLTAPGRAALEEARKVMAYAEGMRVAARSTAQGVRGVLRIGFVGSVTYAFLPRVVPAFRAAYPNVDLKFTESTTLEILHALDARAMDVGLVRYPLLADARRPVVALESHRFQLAVHADHPLARRRKVTLASVRDTPFVLYTRDTVPALHMMVMLMCQEAGFQPAVAQEAAQVQTLISLVESGLGVAIVPDVCARNLPDQVKLVPLSLPGDAPATGIGMVCQEDSNAPLVRNFADLARRVCTAATRARGGPFHGNECGGRSGLVKWRAGGGSPSGIDGRYGRVLAQ